MSLVLAAVIALAPVGSWNTTLATWYGPGFYGNRTACGERMTRWLVGVAMHSWVRCGTRIQVLYHHAVTTLKVVDHCGCASGSVMDLTARADIDIVGGKPYTIPRLRWRWK